MKKNFIVFMAALGFMGLVQANELPAISNLQLTGEKVYQLQDTFGYLDDTDHESLVAVNRTNHVTRNTVIRNTRTNHVTRNTVIRNTRTNHVTRNTVIRNTRTNHVTRNTVIRNTRTKHVIRNAIIRSGLSDGSENRPLMIFSSILAVDGPKVSKELDDFDGEN